MTLERWNTLETPPFFPLCLPSPYLTREVETIGGEKLTVGQ